MIDEKKLIEEIQRQINIEHKKCNEFVALNVGDLVEKYNHGEYCYVNVLHLVQSQPKVGEWIPCSERLPELTEGTEYFKQSECCLVALKWWDGDITESVGWYNESGLWSDDGKNCKVIAWMPLPEAYKEERGGKNE